MELRTTRRIVTGHDTAGKAVVLFDGMQEAAQRGHNGVTMLWVTTEFPVNVAVSADMAKTPVGVPPPASGTIFRIVDFQPAGPHGAPVDHNQILIAMGIDPATQGYARHRNTHRTKSIDYAIVLDGEIDMLMDDTEVHLKAGDVLVEFDGRKIENLYDFTYALRAKKPGDEVLVKVMRGSEPVEATVLLTKRQ